MHIIKRDKWNLKKKERIKGGFLKALAFIFISDPISNV